MKRTIVLLISGLLCFSILLFFLTTQKPQQDSGFPVSEAPTVEWSRMYGEKLYDEAFSVVRTADAGYAIVGVKTSFGAGYGDFWLVKTDANGMIQWNGTYGGANDEEASCIIQTDDEGYAIVGSTNSFGAGDWDVWLVKTYANGTVQWKMTYGGSSPDFGECIIQTADGGYAIVAGTWSFSLGNNDAWLLKTDEKGSLQWNRTYGGKFYDGVNSLIQTSDGGYTLAGSTATSFASAGKDFWLIKTYANGTMQWNKTYGGAFWDRAWCLVQAVDGGYAMAGVTESFGADDTDANAWLVKTYASGTMHWNRVFGGAGWDEVFSIIKTADGGYAIAGRTDSFGSSRDFWLVKTDTDGYMAWNITCGGTGDDEARSVVQSVDGGYVMVGSVNSFGASFCDFWIVKTNSESVIPEFPAFYALPVIAATTNFEGHNWKPELVEAGFEYVCARATLEHRTYLVLLFRLIE